MPIAVIRNESDLKQALIELERFFDNEPEPGTPEAAAFDVLWNLVVGYEDKQWPEGPKLAD